MSSSSKKAEATQTELDKNVDQQVLVLQAANRVAHLVNKVHHIEDAIEEIMFEFLNMVDAVEGSIQLLRPGSGKTHRTLIRKDKAGENILDTYLDNLMTGWAVTNKETLLTNDLVSTFNLGKTFEQFSKVRSVLAAPFLVQGQAIGTVNLIRTDKQKSFSKNEQVLVSCLAVEISEFIAQAQFREKLFDENVQELNAAKDSLIDSESRFRTVAESANDAIITSDITGRITFWNKHAETIFGYPKKEAVGQPLTMLMPAKYHRAHGEGLDRFLKTGKGRIIGQVVELEAIRKDRTELPIELTLASWETHDGRFLTGIIRDVTKRKQEEEELQKAQTQLFQSEKMATLGKLTAGVAHEINTPIGSIISNIDVANRCFVKLEEILEEDKETMKSSEYQKFLKVLRESNRVSKNASDRIANIVRSLKNFTRLDQTEFEKVNLHEGLDSALTLIQYEIKDGIKVVKKYNKIPEIWCYPGELNQVFITMLSNAVQAIENRGTVTVRTATDKTNVYVQISDSGRGMSPEKLKTIFDFSFATRDTRVGMRMGLVHAYNIIQKHNGELRVESKIGKGTTFNVILPMGLKGVNILKSGA